MTGARTLWTSQAEVGGERRGLARRLDCCSHEHTSQTKKQSEQCCGLCGLGARQLLHSSTALGPSARCSLACALDGVCRCRSNRNRSPQATENAQGDDDSSGGGDVDECDSSADEGDRDERSNRLSPNRSCRPLSHGGDGAGDSNPTHDANDFGSDREARGGRGGGGVRVRVQAHTRDEWPSVRDQIERRNRDTRDAPWPRMSCSSHRSRVDRPLLNPKAEAPLKAGTLRMARGSPSPGCERSYGDELETVP